MRERERQRKEKRVEEGEEDKVVDGELMTGKRGKEGGHRFTHSVVICSSCFHTGGILRLFPFHCLVFSSNCQHATRQDECTDENITNKI